MVNGRRRDIGLGGLQRHILIQPSSVGDDIPIEERSHLTLAEARELAVRIRNVAKAGRDPTAVRKRPARIEQKSTPTFEAAAIAAHGAQSHGWSDRSSKAFLARLEEHAYPKLGKMPVDTIHADDVAEALKPIWVAKPATAKKVRQHIATVLDYAAAKRWREYGAPREQVRALTGKPKSSGRNYPSMPYEKVPLYWRDLSGAGETVGRLALMFLIATGARSIEVREAQWRHIDRKKAEWERPAELMRKSDQKHIVTLNKPALDILARAAAYSASHDPDALIFANRKGTTLSDMTISKIMRDDDMPWVPHGFRSSLRTWAAEQQPFIPEPVAAHRTVPGADRGDGDAEALFEELADRAVVKDFAADPAAFAPRRDDIHRHARAEAKGARRSRDIVVARQIFILMIVEIMAGQRERRLPC